MSKAKDEIIDTVTVEAESLEAAWEIAKAQFIKDHPEIDPEKLRLVKVGDLAVN